MAASSFLELVNSRFFAPAVPMFLIVSALWLAAKLRIGALFSPVGILRVIRSERGKGGTSPFRALTVALAGTLGVGNISGVAVAVALGGPGAIFWMWISAFAAMVVKYSETVLAVCHRRSDSRGNYGGAPYYIRYGLKNRICGRAAAAVFAVVCIGASLMTGGVIQANAVAEAFSGLFSVPPAICGVLLAALAAPVLFGGAKKTADMTMRLIPVMTLAYIIMSLYIIISNISAVPGILSQIVRCAFAPAPAAGGAAGFLFSSPVRYGVTKGLFSNEAGCGTSTMAHASSDVKSPAVQGVYGIIEVFVDTVLLCTMTGLVLLIAYGASAPADPGGGVMLALGAFSDAFGAPAAHFLALSVFLFAYATIITWAFYGRECVRYLTHDSRVCRTIYTVLYCASVAAGAAAAPALVWQLADLSVSLLLIVNTSCVLALSETVREASIYARGIAARRGEKGYAAGISAEKA